MNETVREYVDSRGVAMRVDRSAGVIRGVKILGLRSRNGRVYLPEALTGAAALYEGAKVNVNHAAGLPGAPRDYRDRLGVIRNVSVRPAEGLFADFHFNPKHALAEQLVWDAQHAPENVGFSHDVLAKTARRGDQVVVEAITQVRSVDLVADPATTQGLFESSCAMGGLPALAEIPTRPVPLPPGSCGLHDSHPTDSPVKETSNETVNETADETANEARDPSSPSPPATLPMGEGRADTLSRRARAATPPAGEDGRNATESVAPTMASPESANPDTSSPPAPPSAMNEATDELERLRGEVRRLTESETRLRRQLCIRRFLAKVGLPDPDARTASARRLVSARFVESLEAASDEKTVEELIVERAALFFDLARDAATPTVSRPLSREQAGVDSPPPSDAGEFVRAIAGG